MILWLLWVLNLFDAVSTLALIHMKVGREGNPLMAYLINVSPWVFLVVKLLLVSFTCLVLRNRLYGVVRTMTILLVCLYSFLAIYHTVLWVLLIA